jgi:hypothetical protein
MTIESDEQAIRRALEGDEEAIKRALGEVPAEESLHLSPLTEGRDVYHIFFIYMRFNSDGAFIAEQIFHEGVVGKNIIPDTNTDNPDSLGWYAKDMATYSREEKPNRNGRYAHWGDGLEDTKFPPRYSYVVLYMDDIYWPYLEDVHGYPVVPFHEEKEGKNYYKHNKAFTQATKFKIPMTNSNNVTTYREAVVMINRMRNKNDVDLPSAHKETYCFDLRMRVRYAGSTKGLTIIIDPTGENLGPPIP